MVAAAAAARQAEVGVGVGFAVGFEVDLVIWEVLSEEAAEVPVLPQAQAASAEPVAPPALVVAVQEAELAPEMV